MDRRRSILTTVLGAIGLAAATGVSAQSSKRHRVLLDLTADDPERWDGALRNAENVRKAFGPENVEVQLVVHGKAYPLLQKTNADMEARLRSLAEAGVRLSLCQNTMKRFNVTRESLFPFVDTVDAAMAELVRKQEAGWAYVKVGT